MKKSNAIKRTVASSGQVYYFQGGKRVAAAKAASRWVKENFSSISPGQLERLSERELKSFRGRQAATKGAEKIREAANKRVRFGGKFVPSYLQTILEALKLTAPGSELKKEFPDVRNYGDLLKRIQSLTPKTAVIPETEYGLPNEKRRRTTFEGIIDIADRIASDPLYSRLKLMAIDERGNIAEGKINALNMIRGWEIEKIKEIMSTESNVAYVSFGHFGQIDVEKGEVWIDLRETDIRRQYSP